MSVPRGIASAVLDALPHNVTVIDGRRRLVYANASYWRSVGSDPASCPIGSPVEDLIRMLCYRGLYGPGDPEEQVQAVLRIDRTQMFRRRVRSADGRLTTEIMSYPLPDGGYATCGVDVTASAEAERATQARLRLIEGAFSRMGTGIGLYDSDMRLQIGNPAFGALLGLPGILAPGLAHRDIMRLLEERGEFGAGRSGEEVTEQTARERHALPTVDRERPSGEVLRFARQPMPEGGLLVEIGDITALRRAEDEARRRAAVLDGVLGTLPHGVCVFGPDRRVAMFNAAYCRIMDGSPVSIGEHTNDILARRIASGEYSADYGAATSAALFDPINDGLSELHRVRPNGTVIAIRAARLPAGGHISVVTDITALVHAEAEAERRLKLLDGVMATLPHGVLVYGPDRRVAMFNVAYARIMAGAPVQIGEHFDAIMARRVAAGEHSAEYLRTKVAVKFEPGADSSQEVQRVRPNGTAISIRVAEMPDGGHISVVTDITALHRAEEHARERAAILESSLGAMRHGIALFGPDERMRATNGQMAALTGVPHAARQVGQSLPELLETQVALGVITAAQAAAALALDRTKPQGYLRHGADGSVVEVVSDPTPDGGFAITMTDVTALHQAERAARDRAALLERTLGAMRHGISMYGPDHRLILTNARTTDIAGPPAEALVPGVSLRELLESQARRGIITAAGREAALALDRRQPQRYVRAGPDGRVIEVISDPMPDGGFVVSFSDVDALHKAEEAARDRAAMLDAMVAHMPHGVCVYGPDRRVRLTNAAYHAIMGEAAARTGEFMPDLVARRVAMGEFSAERGAMLLRDLQGNAPEPEAVLWRVRPNGTAITTLVGRLPDGGMLSVVTDITALHRAEEAARQRAAMLGAVLESLPVGVTVYDMDRRATLFNAAYSEIMGEASVRLGESLEEVAARRLAMGEFDAAMAQRLMVRHLGPLGDQVEPIRRFRPNGKVIDTRAGRLPDGGYIAVTVDVTALHRAEQDLQQRAAMQEAMLATIRQGVILYNAERRVVGCNAKAQELTGMPAGRMMPGRRMDELIDEQVMRGQIGLDGAAQMKALDRTKPHRYIRMRPDGRVLEVTSDPTPDGGYVIAYADVTDDRQIRADLDRARVEAEGASRAKSRFLATMTHELRSPLAAVIGFAEVLESARDTSRLKDYAGAIREAGRHLLLLIDDILDVARSQSGALEIASEAVALAPVIEGAQAAIAASAAEAGLTLVSQVPACLPRLKGEAQRLHQVLLNLLSNAVKFTPAGGIVTLSVAREEGALAIRIADTGIGIAPADRERVFEPFTQVDSALARRFQGSGLGLYLARTLAEALGGVLTLEDQDGPGTLAVLRFPAERLLDPDPLSVDSL